MAGKVFVSVSTSLDGYMAPEGMTLEHADDPTYKNWLGRWMAMQAWVFRQKFFQENLKLGERGETGPDNAFLEETFRRTGVTIIGKRMFDAGEKMWPQEAPFHTPVFVVTHQKRAPWPRPGGTTFHFVNDGIESALRQAKAVAGGRDVRIGGGANVIVQYLDAGLVDEVHLAVAPVLFGSGVRLFDGIDADRVHLEFTSARASRDVAHLHFAAKRAQKTVETQAQTA